MLPAPCRWIHADSGSYLQWHAGCIAYVAQRDGKWRVCIQSFGIMSEHQAASRQQGERFIERWVCARTGLPGFGSKAVARERAGRSHTRYLAMWSMLNACSSRKVETPPISTVGFTPSLPENEPNQVIEWPTESP